MFEILQILDDEFTKISQLGEFFTLQSKEFLVNHIETQGNWLHCYEITKTNIQCIRSVWARAHFPWNPIA